VAWADRKGDLMDRSNSQKRDSGRPRMKARQIRAGTGIGLVSEGERKIQQEHIHEGYPVFLLGPKRAAGEGIQRLKDCPREKGFLSNGREYAFREKGVHRLSKKQRGR